MSGVIDLTGDDGENDNTHSDINKVVISDDENEDLKLAIAMSLQDQTSDNHTKEVIRGVDVSTQPVTESTSFSDSRATLLGLDRKAMEAERLARLKRKREPESTTQSTAQPPPQPPNTSTRISPPPQRKQNLNSTQSTSIPIHSSTTSKPSTLPSFSTPQVLLTSYPSRRDSTNPQKYTSISFADMTVPPSPNLTLKSVLLSSFIADFDYILPHFNTRTTNFVFVLHAQNAQHRALLEGDFTGLPNVKLVIPEVMGGAGNMHSKIMLLFYQSRAASLQDGAGSSTSEEVCRVAIPSANLTRADWGVGKVMENVVTVVDLPMKSQSAGEGGENHTVYRFEEKLKTQLGAMGVPENVLRKLDKFDFAATRNMEFVFSVSGSHLLDMNSTQEKVTPASNGFFQRGNKADQNVHKVNGQSSSSVLAAKAKNDPARTGLLSLNDAVVSLGLDVSSEDPKDLPQVDFITSSLGNLTTEFARQLYLAICGQLDPAKIVAKPKRASAKSDSDAALDLKILQNFKIYFPSAETVQRSKGGPGAGGTICFQRKWWESNDLIRQCLHDCIGERGDGILMHSKILYVRFKTSKVVHSPDGHDKRYLGWAYVGSANLSESAWGRIVSDAKSRQPKLTCRNWESGILVPVETDDALQTRAPKSEAAGKILRQLEGEHARHADGVQNKAKLELDSTNVLRTGGRVVMQGGAGKQNEASSESETFKQGKEESAMNASIQNEDADKTQELPSLAEVFSGVVPVPLRYPASTHIARQITPWFFME